MILLKKFEVKRKNDKKEYMHQPFFLPYHLFREASVYLKRGPQRIGSIYKKAVYKEYTDATYRTEKVKPDWLGYLGPEIQAEEGDTVVVLLRNSASRPYSLHPHGMNYSKSNEGEGSMRGSVVMI